jgi:hypothetical protein
MSTESLQQTSLKQKLTHEAKELLGIFLFLVVFFEAFGIYRVLLLREFQLEFVRYAAPIVSALVLAKVILIGEFAGLGKRSEQQRLIISTIYKAFVFGLLAVGFHVLEEAVRALVHHKGLAEAFEVLRTASGRYELLGQCLVLFCAFIPFFAFRETRRVLGGSRLYDLFFRRRSGAPY